MNDQLRAFFDEQAKAVDADVLIELCNGDVVQALRAALIASAFLMEENARLKAQTSAGFVRRRPEPKQAKQSGS
jgi:hypothetical protein